jgi:hypothetical protein
MLIVANARPKVKWQVVTNEVVWLVNRYTINSVIDDTDLCGVETRPQ